MHLYPCRLFLYKQTVQTLMKCHTEVFHLDFPCLFVLLLYTRANIFSVMECFFVIMHLSYIMFQYSIQIILICEKVI